MVQSRTIERKFIQALPSDNPYLSTEYIDVLKETFSHRPELLEAYLYGNWDALEGTDQIIQSQWLRGAKTRILLGWAKRPRLVCDTARFGDDETVIMYMETTDVDEQYIMPHCRSVDISSRLAVLSGEHGNCPCVIEATGGDIGAAVIDELVALKKKTVLFSPQGRAADSKRYYNLRAEAWSSAAKKLAKAEIQLSMKTKTMSENDRILLSSQLCTPTYKFRSGKTLVEPKADIKKRLGRSPDRGDCWVIGQWSYEKVAAVAEEERFYADAGQTDLAESYSVESVL